MEKSGGGPKQPVGRVVRALSPPPKHTCSNFVQLLRPNAQSVDHAIFFLSLVAGPRRGRDPSVPGRHDRSIRNLRTKDYLARDLHLPPVDRQRLVGELGEALDFVLFEVLTNLDAIKIARMRVLSTLMKQDEESAAEGVAA